MITARSLRKAPVLDGIPESGRPPSLLTTQTAEDVYREAGVLDDVRDVDHYGNLKGSNERESERLGAVIGFRHVREHETLQAVMRFGRDGRGATVYVHTNTLPEWIEDGEDPVLAGEGRVIGTWSDGMRQVLDVARDLGANGEGWTTGEVELGAVDVGELDDAESAELSRSSSSYTWEFRTSPGERGRSPTDSLETRCTPPADGGEPPPDRGG